MSNIYTWYWRNLGQTVVVVRSYINLIYINPCWTFAIVYMVIGFTATYVWVICEPKLYLSQAAFSFRYRNRVAYGPRDKTAQSKSNVGANFLSLINSPPNYKKTSERSRTEACFLFRYRHGIKWGCILDKISNYERK